MREEELNKAMSIKRDISDLKVELRMINDTEVQVCSGEGITVYAVVFGKELSIPRPMVIEHIGHCKEFLTKRIKQLEKEFEDL